MASSFSLDAAQAYLIAPHEGDASPILHPQWLLSDAAVFGCRPTGRDVLDLGCGAGTLLEAIAPVSGRLVGIDITPSNCDIARARMARFGSRAQILCADLETLDVETLGGFDLIYCVGVMYVTPPLVQKRLIETIGNCLNPGGVALISYYAGPIYDLVSRIYRLITAEIPPGLAPAHAVAFAREVAAHLVARPEIANAPLGVEAVNTAMKAQDLALFHHLATPDFCALSTLKLERDFDAKGVSFLTYLNPVAFAALPTSLARAGSAELMDLPRGNYRFGLYGKSAQPPSLDRDGLKLSTTLRRDESARQADGTATYFKEGSGIRAGVSSGLVQSALDLLARQPASFRDLLGVMHHQGALLSDQTVEEIHSELMVLWSHRLLDASLAAP